MLEQAIDLFTIATDASVLKDNFVFEVRTYDYNSQAQRQEVEEVRKEQQMALDRKIVDVESLNRVCTL